MKTAISESLIDYQTPAREKLHTQKLSRAVSIITTDTENPDIVHSCSTLGKILGFIPVVKTLTIKRTDQNPDGESVRNYLLPGMKGFGQTYALLKEEAKKKEYECDY